MGEASTKDNSARTTAQIEADISRTRTQLAATLDELAMRVHPTTISAQVKAKAVASVEEKAARAYVAASGLVEKAKAQFVDEDGRPRKERVVPAALVGAGLVLLVASARKRRKS
ncbi:MULTISPECIES: DUF3618 domain-containing protein [Streptomycetaceae]|uniref:DUF3618 domain-containing protein n=1 Tax=Streptomycetaceae TaxID=2062 RepID=UPI000CDC6427|nr:MULTISPECIES: DUF3618 domain-containing protein [Streptomycetaceae]AUY51612.1 hypothetical protein C2142_24745 [Streptomyces sp. CB01881]MBP0454155.1 DUF3618 domain-containing protein [Kitasatospora sp. RG8]TYC75003.1 DUF3618 domain-containing protein [Streptomyces sp. CB01881]